MLWDFDNNICKQKFMEFQKIHIGEEINKVLHDQQRSLNWLADEMGCDHSNLYKKLKKPHICCLLLYRISEVLHVDFFSYYSQSLSFNLNDE